MNDTTNEAQLVRLRALQAMNPTRRLSLALGWSQSVRDLNRAAVRRQFPDSSEPELHRLVAERWLGAALAEKVYGPLKAHG